MRKGNESKSNQLIYEIFQIMNSFKCFKKQVSDNDGNRRLMLMLYNFGDYMLNMIESSQNLDDYIRYKIDEEDQKESVDGRALAFTFASRRFTSSVNLCYQFPTPLEISSPPKKKKKICPISPISSIHNKYRYQSPIRVPMNEHSHDSFSQYKLLIDSIKCTNIQTRSIIVEANTKLLKSKQSIKEMGEKLKILVQAVNRIVNREPQLIVNIVNIFKTV